MGAGMAEQRYCPNAVSLLPANPASNPPSPPTHTQPSLAHLLLMTAESPSPLTAEYDFKTVQWRKRNSSSSTDGTIKPGVRWQQEGH